MWPKRRRYFLLTTVAVTAATYYILAGMNTKAKEKVDQSVHLKQYGLSRTDKLNTRIQHKVYSEDIIKRSPDEKSTKTTTLHYYDALANKDHKVSKVEDLKPNETKVMRHVQTIKYNSTQIDTAVSNQLQTRVNSDAATYVTNESVSAAWQVNQAKAWTKEYCNPPELAATGTEGVVADRYKLVNVHVLIRHGERMPMDTADIPGFHKMNIHCRLDKNEYNKDSTATEYIDLVNQLSTTFQGLYRMPLYPNSDKCIQQQLTPLGALQLFHIGKYLHKTFVDKHRLLSDDENLKETIHFRSTVYTRAIQSGVAFMLGLLPGFAPDKVTHRIVDSLNMKLCLEKFSRLPCRSQVADVLQLLAERKANVITPDEAWTSHKLRDLLRLPKSAKAPFVMEQLFIPACRLRPLPCRTDNTSECFDWLYLYHLWKNTEFKNERLNFTTECQTASLLTAKPFLWELINRFTNISHGLAYHKFILYSGHDKTLRPLLIALGITNARWIRYGARLVFELYRLRHSTDKIHLDKQQYFLRILYNGEDQTDIVTFCNNGITEDKLCILDKFILNVRTRFSLLDGVLT